MSCYFKSIEDKYNPLLSYKNPVIVKAHIKLDKRDIRFNVGCIKDIDFIVRKITKDISAKYKCLAFSTFNEINIVLNNPSDLVENGKLETHDVVSLFSQEIFMRYNELTFSKKRSFVSVNAFNVFEDKVKSYLYSRQSIGFNNYVSTLGAKMFSYNQLKNKSREEILDIIETISPSLVSLKKYIRDGYASSNGKEIELYKIKDLNSISELLVNCNETVPIINKETIISLQDDIVEDI